MMVLTHTDFVRNGPLKSSSFSFVPAILEYNIISKALSRLTRSRASATKCTTWASPARGR
jgi:hypothetical protein